MLWALLLALAASISRAQDGPAPPTPFDRVLVLELEAQEEELGPREQRVELELEFDGRVHCWLVSELALELCLERADGTRVGSDRGERTGGLPFLRSVARAGDTLRLCVVGRASHAAGRAELVLAALPEDERTRARAAELEAGLSRARVLGENGERQAARAELRSLLELALGESAESSGALLHDALWKAGFLASDLEDLPAAERAWSAVLLHRERTLPPTHRDLQFARENLSHLAYARGATARARALAEHAVLARRRSSPPDDPELLAAESFLGALLAEQGEVERAISLLERVVEGLERAEPAVVDQLAAARGNLANVLRSRGDLARARLLYERTLAALEARPQTGIRGLLVARANLALSMADAGDFLGAAAQLARALEDGRAALPAEHPDLTWIRASLASLRIDLADGAGARELAEEILLVAGRDLPSDHDILVRARTTLALSHMLEKRHALAAELLEQTLATWETRLPPWHRSVLINRHNLAVAYLASGELERAAEQAERVLLARAERLPAEHLDLLHSREVRALVALRAGEPERARAEALAMLTALARGAEQAALLAQREARESLTRDARRLALALALVPADEPASSELCFEVIENRRLASAVAGVGVARAAVDASLRPLLAELDGARAALHDLVGGGLGELAGSSFAAELTRLSGVRDDAERSLRRALVEQGRVPPRVSRAEAAARLPADGAAVTYVRHQDRGDPRGEERGDLLSAHVLRADGALRRVTLGACEELEPLVEAWRAALGGSAHARGREPGASEDSPDEEREAGERLRRRLLDPLLETLGPGLRTLFVCPDDLVHLVPLDALPEGEARLGDRLRVVQLTSLGQLERLPALSSGDGRLVLLGGVDYAAAGAEAPLASASTPPLSALAAGERSGAGASFPALPGTLAEVRAIARLHEGESTLLSGAAATKPALAAAAVGARFLHLATHGWFAGESVRSQLDPPRARAADGLPDSAESVRGFAPLTLCGLALAGAERGGDELGRVSGLLTAEELCAFDLSACELAVLSACETNVGLRRAGQGIQSLQSALHAAGARSAVTSLWRVDDEATRELMEGFYRYRWREGSGTAEALWRAKQDLRARGRPPRDWAGWVLSGAPD